MMADLIGPAAKRASACGIIKTHGSRLSPGRQFPNSLRSLKKFRRVVDLIGIEPAAFGGCLNISRFDSPDHSYIE